MWIAKLKIVDTIRNRKDCIDYKFNRIMKYIDLYRDLGIILRFIGYEDCFYRMTQISFTFRYLNKDVFVDNWYNKYILNRDEIEIKISSVPIIYSLIDSISNNTILKHRNIKKIYLLYSKILKFETNNALLIKADNILVDVLDDGQYYLNDCINRLIHRYNY